MCTTHDTIMTYMYNKYIINYMYVYACHVHNVHNYNYMCVTSACVHADEGT